MTIFHISGKSDKCCHVVEVINNHDNKYSMLMGIYASVDEKINDHAFYQADPIYPPKSAKSRNINSDEE